MRNRLLLLTFVAVAGFLAGGCAKMENKLGRGMRNSYEIVRTGELRRSMEQTAVFEGPDVGYTTGFVRGLNRTLARTGVGIYEIITFPFPPYGPAFTDYLAPNPVYPDNFKPSLVDDPMYQTDNMLGFGGGAVLPGIPNNRFIIFEGN